ncbi:MAG: flagellar export chaperone FlgN [Hydrogenovibrio sp.]
MRQASDIRDLSPALSELLDALTQFHTVLEDEAAALKSSDTHDLVTVLEQKEQLSESVSAQFETIAARLTELTGTESPMTLNKEKLQASPHLPASVKKSLLEIADKAQGCQKRNIINGMTMQALSQLNQTTLNLLTGRNENAKTYSAAGKAIASQNQSNPIGKA